MMGVVSQLEAAERNLRLAKSVSLVVVVVGTQYRCPCCGYRTLAAPAAMELCPVCWWEDDGQEDEDASEVRLTVNGPLSLTDARMHFTECGASHPRYLPYVRKPVSGEN
jgi:hypothetical protein